MSITGMPRPLKFNSLNQFVLSSSNNFDQSYNKPTSPISNKNQLYLIRNTQSLYDRYNVNNLLLNKVNQNHIQIITKNIVLNQQDLTPTIYNNTFHNTKNNTLNNNRNNNNKTITQVVSPSINNQTKHNNFLQTNITGVNSCSSQLQTNSPKKVIPHTSQGFYIPQDKSKQYNQNQLLFNFNQMAQQKKAKKKQFLQTIQAKLNLIQQQAKQLQQCHFQQQINLQQIQNIQNQLSRQLTTNAFNSKINQKIYTHLQQQDQQQQQYTKPKSLHLNMGPVQINHVLNTHFDQNQKLLDQIIRVKSKSKQKNNTSSQWDSSPDKSKQFQRTAINTNLNKTSFSQGEKTLLPNQTQKKLISTTMKLPPKHNKK